MLITFRDRLSRVPVSERTLRAVVAELGFRPPQGRHKLLFNEAQVKLVEEALVCRSSRPRSSVRLPPEDVNRRRAMLARQSREIMKRVRAEMDAKGGG